MNSMVGKCCVSSTSWKSKWKYPEDYWIERYLIQEVNLWCCRTGNPQHRPLEINGVHPNSVIQRTDFYRVDEKGFQTGKPNCMSSAMGWSQ